MWFLYHKQPYNDKLHVFCIPVARYTTNKQIHKYTKFHGAVDHETEVTTKNKNWHNKNSQNFGVFW